MAVGKFGETKAKPWKGTSLKGSWQITLKIDGARMLRDVDGNPVSRAGKPLYNLGHISKDIVDAEIYAGNWEDSMSLVRTSVNGSPVDPACVYSLDPIDARLVLPSLEDPTVEELQDLMEAKVSEGYEGLILRQGDRWLKVKPKDTADVLVTGFQKGTGKHIGRMGALVTNYAKIGTGFSDKQREEWQDKFDKRPEGFLETSKHYLIEVEYMEITKYGKLRHPRYLRVRTDKTEESLGEGYVQLKAL